MGAVEETKGCPEKDEAGIGPLWEKREMRGRPSARKEREAEWGRGH